MSMLISDDEVEHTRYEAGDLQALQHLAAKTSRDGYWVGLIHFLAIANVIGYTIKSFYPRNDCLCETMKLLLNSCMPPTHAQSAGQITIMWSHTNSTAAEQTTFAPNHFVPLADNGEFFFLDDDLYNEKTFAILDPVVLSTLEPPTSDWETDDNIPLKKIKPFGNTSTPLKEPDSQCDWETDDNIPLNELKCSPVFGSFVDIGMKDTNETADDDNSVQSEDHLSDLESLSSEECDTESSSGDEGDDEDEVKISTDGPINWLEPFRKIMKRPFCGEKPGPKIRLGKETNEANLFKTFLGENFLERAASASNKYIHRYQTKLPNLTSTDIAAYLGIRIIMGVDPKSCIDDYWSTDTCLSNKCVSNTMSKNLCKDIHRVFHVDDPENASHTSALERVNDLLLNMREKSKEMFNLNENLSIDEAMIKFHGKHSGVVGAPNKPAKRGYKIYTLADGHTGYVWDFEVYLRTSKREEGLTKRVVETLCKDVTGKNHIVYVDKFYTSIPLALSLLKKKIYLCGSFNTS